MKKIILKCLWILTLLILIIGPFTSSNLGTKLDNIIEIIQYYVVVIISIIIPVILLTNIRNVRDKLPLYKQHRIRSTVLAIFLTWIVLSLLLSLGIGIAESFHTTQYREAYAEKMRDKKQLEDKKESEAKKSEKKQEVVGTKKTEDSKKELEKKEKTEDEKKKKTDREKVKLKEIDMSEFKDKAIDEFLDLLEDVNMNAEGNMYYDTKKLVSLEVDNKKVINTIVIKGNPRLAPYFGEIHLEDTVSDIDKKIVNSYQLIGTVSVSSDKEGKGVRDYREKNTTNKLSLVYDIKSKKVTEVSWVFNGIDFIFPDSNEKVIAVDEINELTDTEKQIAVNEIFARHERKFKDSAIQNYFNSKKWYKGSVEAEKFDENVFNSFEKENILRLSGGASKEQEQNTIVNEESVNGYIYINPIIQSIIKNPEEYVGQKVCFEGMLQKRFNGILELSYFQGNSSEIQVSVYYDEGKLKNMPDAHDSNAATIIWGTVLDADSTSGVEIQLDSVYFGMNTVQFPKKASGYYQVSSFSELNFSDNFKIGEKIILQGTLAYDDNYDYILLMEGGECMLSGSQKDFDNVSINISTTLDSFIGKEVQIHGFYVGNGPLVGVNYIEPLN